MKILFSIFFNLFLVVITLISCNQPKKIILNSKTILETPLENSLETYDPTWTTALYSHRVLTQVYEGLVKMGEDNLPKPALAEKIEISSDGKVYTFYIRKGVKFHNHHELTAHDVKFSLERACDPILASPNAVVFLNDIEGALEKIKGQVKDIHGIQVLNKHCLRITLKAPKVCFLSKLTYDCAFIFPKDHTPKTQITKREQVIGTGPFKFSNYYKDQLIILNANYDYWGEKPKVAQIKFHIVKDQLTLLNQYKSGRYHFCFAPPLDIPKLRKHPIYSQQLKFKNHASIFFLELNPKVYPAFKNIKVRQAFAMAIEPHYIVKYTLNDTADVANAFIAQGISGHRNKTTRLDFNPKKAKKLLTEAGYNNGLKLPPLKLFTTNHVPSCMATAETIALQITKNLGIKVSVKQLDWNTYLHKKNNRELGLRLAYWGADYFDPANFLSDLFLSDSNMNTSNYSNPKFDLLCKKADAMSNSMRRLKLYHQAEDILLKDAQIIPLYYPKDAWLIRNNVRGLKFDLGGIQPFNTIIIEK